jgi:hypothetical protein
MIAYSTLYLQIKSMVESSIADLREDFICKLNNQINHSFRCTVAVRDTKFGKGRLTFCR